LKKCIECYKCEKVCPFSITTFKDPDNINCIRCGKCIEICPTNALSLKFSKEPISFKLKIRKDSL